MVWNPLKGYNPLKDYAQEGGWLGPNSVSWSVLNSPIKAASNAYERLTKGMNPLRPYRTYAAESIDSADQTPAEQGPEYGPFQSDLMPTATPTSTTTTDPEYAWWMGNRYNFSDPNDVTNYAGARSGYINDLFGRKYSEGEKSYLGGIAGVERDLGNLSTNRNDYLTDWQDQYVNLGKTYQGKRAGISNYYSGLGDIYQSSQGVREKSAQDVFEQGKTKAERERERSLDNFTQQEADLNREKVEYGNWWTNLQREIDEQKSQELDSVYNALDEAGDTAEAQRLAGMADVNERLRTNPYQAVTNMDALSDELASLGSKLPTAQTGGSTTRNAFSRVSGEDEAAEIVNKYYSAIEKTGDPSKALGTLSAYERQILSQLGI